MMLDLESTIVIFAAFLTWASSQNPVLSPPVFNTYLNGSVLFVCTKETDMEVAWVYPLFPESFHTSNSDTARFSIDIPDISYNKSIIYCVGRYPSQKESLYYSNPGEILIQGYLSKVDAKLQILEPCKVQVFWNAPFTLPGVPILGYKVYVTNTDTNSTDYFFVNDSSIDVPFGYNYNVTIVGNNIVGDGNRSIIIINSENIINETQKLNSRLLKISRNITYWNIDIMLEDSEKICQDYNNSQVLCNFCEQSNSSCFNSQVKLSQNNTILSASAQLIDNQKYDVTILNKIGESVLESSSINMSTFDVQSVQEFNKSNNGFICLEITYVKGSLATGCHVSLSCMNYTPQYFNIIGYDNEFYKIWCEKTDIVGVQTCSLEVYDLNDKEVDDNTSPAVQLNITVIGSQVVLSSSTFATTSPTAVDSGSSSSTLIAIVVVMVIAVIVALLAVFIIIGKYTCSKGEKDEYMMLLLLEHQQTIQYQI